METLENKRKRETFIEADVKLLVALAKKYSKIINNSKITQNPLESHQESTRNET